MIKLLAKTYPEDKGYRVEEAAIRSAKELLEFLDQRGAEPPAFFDLVAPSGLTATVGAGGSWWCLMFMAADGEPPYMWLRNDRPEEDLDDVEFDACGTLTPVPAERLLDPGQVKAACVDFLTTGDRPKTFSWDED